jgi:hypothetical protein
MQRRYCTEELKAFRYLMEVDCPKPSIIEVIRDLSEVEDYTDNKKCLADGLIYLIR